MIASHYRHNLLDDAGVRLSFSDRLMTVVYMEQCQSWRNTVLDIPQKRLETLSGKPVPHSVAAWNDYRGRERIFIPTLRTTVLSDETLNLDIIVHTAKPPKTAVLFWKTMGTNEPYQKTALRPVHGNHYTATLPPLNAKRNAIEYYIEAETENPQGITSLLRFPSTAPELNQTVIVFPLSQRIIPE
jgi:hypothetical protein